MALFKTGGFIGMISGSVGPNVFSRNRYGSYVRARAKPVSPNTAYQQAAKAALSAASQHWGGIGLDAQNAWRTWAQTHPITNRIGEKQVLSGQAACTQLNARQIQQGGALLDLPPTTAAPDSLTTLTASLDIGAGAFTLGFTPTPIGAANRLWIWAAVVNSPGVSYVTNLYKLVRISALNQATGIDTQADIEERFGTLQEGQVIHFLVQVSDNATGLQSGGFPIFGAVTST